MRGKPIRLAEFTGGINLKASPQELDLNETPFARNVLPAVRGAAVKRPGDSRVLRLGLGGVETVRMLYGAQVGGVTDLFGGVSQDLLPTFDNNLYRSHDGGAPAAVVSAGVLGTPVEWEVAVAPANGGQGPVYGTYTGAANLAFYVTAAGGSGTWTATAGTLPDRATMLKYHGNRLWAAGMAAYGAFADPLSVLAYSNLANPRDWAGAVELAPGDGNPLTAICPIGAYLLAGKQDKLWLIYDLDTGANRPVGNNVGCIAYRSMVETPHGVVFLSRDRGFLLTDGASVKPLSDELEPLLASLRASGVAKRATAVYWRDRYICAFPGSGIGGRGALILDYDFPTKSWWMHTGDSHALTLAGLVAAGTVEPRVYAGAVATSDVDWLFSGSAAYADGTPLDADYWTPFVTLGALPSRIHAVTARGRGNLGFTFAKDYAVASLFTPSPILRTYPEAALADADERRMADLGAMRALQTQVFNDTATSMQLNELTVWATQRRD